MHQYNISWDARPMRVGGFLKSHWRTNPFLNGKEHKQNENERNNLRVRLQMGRDEVHVDPTSEQTNNRMILTSKPASSSCYCLPFVISRGKF